MTIFVDASAFIALWKKDDLNHLNALQKSQKVSKTKVFLVTSNIVIAEVLTVMAMRISKQVTDRFLEYIERSNVKVVFVDEDLHIAALKIFRETVSKNVSFFDCTAFAAMQLLRIKKVFTFDKDFQRYGFEMV